MAYVRVRGKQLALVRSVRDPKTKEVAQEVLFVLYSRAEARAALGRSTPGGAEHFRAVLRDAYPDHKFDWSAVRRGIESNLEVLPEMAPHGADASQERFREVVHACLRELAQLHPYSPASGQRPVLEALGAELRFAQELIGKCLTALQEAPPALPALLDQHPPLWRFGTRSEGPTPDVEEEAMELYERGDLDVAEERFRILTDIFPRYAEGLNTLGCIALDRGRLPQARAYFEKTVEVARKHFPARIGRSMWWSLLETRPYIRGLHNLASTLIREGRYPEAFAAAERLGKECLQEERAVLLRARVYLNTERFEEASGESVKLVQIWPSEGFPAGLAFAEGGDVESAKVHLLHALLNHPMSGGWILDGRAPRPRSWSEGRDWEVAQELRGNLRAYLAKRNRPGLVTLRSLLRDSRVQSLIDRVRLLGQEHREGKDFNRARFDEIQRMHSLEFARETAGTFLKSA